MKIDMTLRDLCVSVPMCNRSSLNIAVITESILLGGSFHFSPDHVVLLFELLPVFFVNGEITPN
jgi:hypothetical protein